MIFDAAFDLIKRFARKEKLRNKNAVSCCGHPRTVRVLGERVRNQLHVESFAGQVLDQARNGVVGLGLRDDDAVVGRDDDGRRAAGRVGRQLDHVGFRKSCENGNRTGRSVGDEEVALLVGEQASTGERRRRRYRNRARAAPSRLFDVG